LVMARDFAAEGAQLVLVARDAQELHNAAVELRQQTRVHTIQADLTEPDAPVRVVAEALQRFGRVDVLINNAGVIQSGPLDHLDERDFEQAMAIHFWAPLRLMRAVTPGMRAQGGGRIVNISSIGGRIAVPHLVPYCASKFALSGLSDGMRAELAPQNIKVTTVNPGLMRTGSHVNAQFKGRHELEYAWFTLLNALPFTSIHARTASRAILEACRRGQPQLTVSVQAKVLYAVSGLVPNLVAHGLNVMNWLLPDPTDASGNQTRSGWESRSSIVPPLLTVLADRATVENNGMVQQHTAHDLLVRAHYELG
jgi:short-subunit dehydrogenase